MGEDDCLPSGVALAGLYCCSDGVLLLLPTSGDLLGLLDDDEVSLFFEEKSDGMPTVDEAG